MDKTVLIVERDPTSAQQLKLEFEKFGFNVRCTTSGKAAIEMANKLSIEAIILEWDLQDIEGIEVCKTLRQRYKFPLIMISSRADEIDSVLALELGATDYLRKPVGIRELITRLRIHLKRFTEEQFAVNNGADFEVGPFKVAYLTFKVYKDGIELSLTHSEFKLLTYLLGKPRQILSREQLIEVLELTIGDKRTVDVHIRRLREKIEEKPSSPKWLKTKSGVGYYFNSQ